MEKGVRGKKENASPVAIYKQVNSMAPGNKNKSPSPNLGKKMGESKGSSVQMNLSNKAYK